MKVALAQINPTVGDISGNGEKIARCIERAEAMGAELVVFGELSIMGYPLRDLLAVPAAMEGGGAALNPPSLVARSVRAVEELAGKCRQIAALVGFVRPADDSPGRPLENAAALLAGGKLAAVHVKTLLLKYDVFDETRYFRPGPSPAPLTVNGRRVGVSICEDMWDRPAPGQALYEAEPVAALRAGGAEIIVNMSASPFQVGKLARREELIRRQAARAAAPVIYVNQVGGNDELIFDGASMAVAPDGTVLGRCGQFREDLLVVDTDGRPGRVEPVGADVVQLAAALKLGLRDYVAKCGFRSVVLGLSGGVDSAVVAALAADALGPENVLALVMPSRFTAEESLADARRVARNLGIGLVEVPIEPVHATYERIFSQHLPADRPSTTDENIQARIRGNLVMAFSNAAGHLPLATGNKSELATGYCTLYGDMNGGLSVIGDVPKTMVYRLARHLNETAGGRIPQAVLDKPPSAELKPDQIDQDTLPPYDLLDEILLRYVEQARSVEQIVAEGYDAEVVRRVAGMVDRAEYKRRQAAPVLKVTGRAFGSGRRIPIACRREHD